MKMFALFRLAMALLARDWRAGEWKVLLLALLLAVASLATVGFFADRVKQALYEQSASLIGADIRLSSSRPLAPSFTAAAQQYGLQTVDSKKLMSMAIAGEQSVLSEIVAVEQGYPLRGRITTAPALGQAMPAAGTVWVDRRLLDRLQLQIGDYLTLGDSRLQVAALVVQDVDQSIDFARFAPRLLMNLLDLPSTGLILPGSRLKHRLLIAGDAAAVAQLYQQYQLRKTPHVKIENVRDARPEVRLALERAEHFLGLAALTAAILAGVALLLAARRFVSRHLDSCAVMRCLGAQQSQLLWLFLYQFLLVGLIAVLLGSVLGYLTQALLISLVESFKHASLPPPTLWPAVKASLSGFALLLGFAFLPLLQLRKVSPLRVLRRELGLPSVSVWLVYGLALAVLAALFLWQAGSWKLGLSMLGGLLAGLLLFAMIAWGMLRLAARYGAYAPMRLRHALANLYRHGAQSALQIVAISLGGMALLLLTLVRADLMESWQSRLPQDAPNRFVVNIEPEQQRQMREFFIQHQLPQARMFPMIRGRLVEINGQPVDIGRYAEARTQRLASREFNLSYMEKMPDWNRLVAGAWWPPGAREQISMEAGIAQRLGVKLGDRLSYDVAGTRFSATVTSLREVSWDSMRVNFFVITSPDVLRDFYATLLTSFYVPDAQAQAMDRLSVSMPNLLVIDTGAILQQVRDIMDQITQTMSAIFLFTLLSGVAVLYAALLATRDERIKEAAILRTLGVNSAYLRRLYLAEFGILGMLSGVFAAAGAVLLGWVIAEGVLNMPYRPGLLIWPLAVVSGMLLVMLAGWLGTRHLLRQPPLVILKES